MAKNNSEKTLCDVHDEIRKLCEEIIKSDHESPHFKRRVISRIEKINDLSCSAKKHGQRMENRLREYYDGIVGLGFLRTK